MYRVVVKSQKGRRNVTNLYLGYNKPEHIFNMRKYAQIMLWENFDFT
jgi:hypothetical protein